VDLVYLSVWDGLQAVSRVLGIGVSWMEERATVLIIALAAALLVGARFLAPAVLNVEAIPSPRIPALLVAACTVAALALVAAALSRGSSRRLTPLMILAGAAAIAGLTVAGPWLRLGLLEAGALLTIPLVWQNARTRSAKLAYLTVVVISALSLVGSDLLMERGQADWARALLITSVCVKLAAVPLFFWLLRLADELPALVLGLIIAVVDMAAFGELYVASQASPGSLTPQGLWLGIAAATSFLAALLMLTQRSLKRLLVLSTVEDVGFLLLGLASARAIGYSGALFAASTHALAKALLFTCLSGPEAAGALDGEHTGLATRYPVSAFGFLFGMLAMLGVPPTLGYIGRWRLYETALGVGPFLLAVFILSSIMALIAYVLALTRVWWGPECAGDSPPEPVHASREPFLIQATIVVLVVLLLAAGIWPDAMRLLQGGRP
jgi:formate hydrogenlyase subunit 3/multisubunit Na+/H+ antiporter MnhD subunit